MLSSTYISQELPKVRNKVIYFVGSQALEIEEETNRKEILATLENFITLLEVQESHLDGLPMNEVELLYNQVFEILSTFQKMKTKLEANNYFDLPIFHTAFEAVLTKIKSLRKVLLSKIEGDLIKGISLLNKNNISQKIS